MHKRRIWYFGVCELKSPDVAAEAVGCGLLQKVWLGCLVPREVELLVWLWINQLAAIYESHLIDNTCHSSSPHPSFCSCPLIWRSALKIFTFLSHPSFPLSPPTLTHLFCNFLSAESVCSLSSSPSLIYWAENRRGGAVMIAWQKRFVVSGLAHYSVLSPSRFLLGVSSHYFLLVLFHFNIALACFSFSFYSPALFLNFFTKQLNLFVWEAGFDAPKNKSFCFRKSALTSLHSVPSNFAFTKNGLLLKIHAHTKSCFAIYSFLHSFLLFFFSFFSLSCFGNSPALQNNISEMPTADMAKTPCLWET